MVPLNDQLKKTLLQDEKSELALTRSEKRRIQIIEATIRYLATEETGEAIYRRVARACRVSRPLVKHYFPDREALFLLAVKYVRAHFQDFAVRAMEGESSLEGQFRAYVESCFDWAKEFPSYGRVWVLFFSACIQQKRARALNSDLVKMGQERISALLGLGLKNGILSPPGEVPLLASMIQSVIAGAMVTIATEDLGEREAGFRAETIRWCRKIAGFPTD